MSDGETRPVKGPSPRAGEHAKPLRPVGERFYIDVVGDVLRIDQAMMAWWKAYVLVFTAVMYAAGVGGLIAAIVTDDLGGLPLLGFPAQFGEVWPETDLPAIADV